MRRRSAPRARTEGLLVQELPQEVLVYDTVRQKAHCLNTTAAFIWKHCDGRRSAHEIVQHLEKTLGTRVDEDVVWCALNQLEKDHLLEEKIEWPASVERISRRELVRRLGIGAAIAIPIITSIVAPSVAYAGSTCTTKTCTTLADCGAACTRCDTGLCF
ncbi:MAG TPA: PqqD family protein [Pyrinomonadaceae bacterium]|nr:PqqD family protein [Pyrinomonadaceae bacterium]